MRKATYPLEMDRGRTGLFLILLGSMARAQLPPDADLEKKIIPELIRQLQGSDRAQALYTLDALGPYATNAVPAILRRMALEKDKRATELYIQVLGDIGAESERSVPVLRRMLKDPAPSVRLRALEALVKFGEASAPAVPEMLKVLKHEQVDSRQDYALIARGGPFARAALPYYRAMIPDDNVERAARGLSAALRISSTSVANVDVGSREMRRGSLQRRCRLASLLFAHAPLSADLRKEIVAMTNLPDEVCQGRLAATVRSRGTPLTDSRKKVAASKMLKIAFDPVKSEYFAGEPILLTPRLADGSQRDAIEKMLDRALARGEAPFDFMPKVFRGGTEVRPRKSLPMSILIVNVMFNGAPQAPIDDFRAYRLDAPATLFIRAPGRYRLIIPYSTASIDGVSLAIYSKPFDIVVSSPTEKYLQESFAKIDSTMKSSDVFAKARAVTRLCQIPDDRVIPRLLHALDDISGNVIKPALLGLLAYPDHAAVAREIRKAVARGEPIHPQTIRYFTDILARCENPKESTQRLFFQFTAQGEPDWNDYDPAWERRVDAESEKWRLLLERRHASRFSWLKLTPLETLKALADGETPTNLFAACQMSYASLLFEKSSGRADDSLTVISKCGDKLFLRQLRSLSRDQSYDFMTRSLSYLKRRERGDKSWLTEILADMASPRPSMPPAMNEAYLAALDADASRVSEILQAHLDSAVPERVEFVSAFLSSLDIEPWSKLQATLDIARARRAILAANACRGGACLGIARYFRDRAPEDALALIENTLSEPGSATRFGYPEDYSVLVQIPPDIAGRAVRKRLQSSNPQEAQAMAAGIWRAAVSDTKRENLRAYFPDLLAYYRGHPNAEGKLYAARAMCAISHIPEVEPMPLDPNREDLWLKGWAGWLANNENSTAMKP